MKRWITLTICLLLGLLTLAGCSCKHTWVEADCVTAKTCSACQLTEGEPLGHTWTEADCMTAKTCATCGSAEGDPLGHTPGEWNEAIDIVTCTGSREQYCAVCNALTASEDVSLSTLIRDDHFLFTPREFMDRLTLLAQQHSDEFTYEYVPNGPGLQVLAYINGKQAIIQFFRSNATALGTDELDTAEVWCMSLIAVGEGDADFRLYFLMACDPTLDKDAAFAVDMDLSAAFTKAAATGGFFAYHKNNQLRYEICYIPESSLGQDYSMNMLNIYASDFR